MSATPDTQVHINNLKYLFDYLWFVWPDEPHPSIYHSDLAPEFSWEPLDLHWASWYLPHHAIRLDWVTFRGKKQKHWTEAPTPQRNHTWHKVHWSNLTVHLGWGLFLFIYFFKSLTGSPFLSTHTLPSTSRSTNVRFSFELIQLLCQESELVRRAGCVATREKCPKRILSLNPFFLKFLFISFGYFLFYFLSRLPLFTPHSQPSRHKIIKLQAESSCCRNLGILKPDVMRERRSKWSHPG